MRRTCFLPGIAALMVLCFLNAAYADAFRLPVSPECKNVNVDTGVWYAVRKPTKPLNMRGLRYYYLQTLRREGNIFGTDYCTFERYLVYANLKGANGKPVNDRMTNLVGLLLLPVKPELGTHWICFDSDPAHTSCKGKPAMVAGATLTSGAVLWEQAVLTTEQSTKTDPLSAPPVQTPKVRPLTESTPSLPANAQLMEGLSTIGRQFTDQLEALQKKSGEQAVRLDTVQTLVRETKDGIAAVLEQLKALSATTEQRDTKPLSQATQLAERQATEQNTAQAEKLAALSNEVAKLSGVIEGLRQSVQVITQAKASPAPESVSQSKLAALAGNLGADFRWLYAALAALSVALLFATAAIVVLVTRSRRRTEGAETHARGPLPLVNPIQEREPEPLDTIEIVVPQGMEGEGLKRSYEVFMKTKGREGGYDVWVMPDHLRKKFGHLTPIQLLEKVLENPRQHLVLARNLPDHWKKCSDCKQSLAEAGHTAAVKAAVADA